MNARVFLLILVTGAFMAVWDADRPNLATSTLAMATAHDHSLQQISAITLIPLPTGLQSGTWQVFNHNGDTFRITVEGQTNNGQKRVHCPGIHQQICVVTGSDGIRWCFVRNSIEVARENEACPQ